MKKALLLTLASLTLASSLAGQERSPVQGAPRISGREIARFVVAAPIRFYSQAYDSTGRWHATVAVIPAAQFIPVSEDRGGVYFQSTAGLGAPRETEGNYSPGGLYVGKQRVGDVYAYFGDARGQGRILKSLRELDTDAQKKLLVAGTGQGKAAAKVGKP